jgi:hypothetical protein
MIWRTLLRSNKAINDALYKFSEFNIIPKISKIETKQIEFPIAKSKTMHLAPTAQGASSGVMPFINRYTGTTGEFTNKRTIVRKQNHVAAKGLNQTNVNDMENPIVDGPSKPNIYDGFNKIKDPHQRFEYLLDKANTMDVSTAKNQAIFYSGKVITANGTISARQIAERYADQLVSKKGITKLTLERTPGGKWMDDLGLFNETAKGVYKYEELGLTNGQAKEIWRTLSSRYADGTSGAITAFTKNVPNVRKPDTIFWSTELPQLRRNSSVTHINIR